MPIRPIAALLLAGLLTPLAAQAMPELPSHRDLNLQVARQLLDAAGQHCQAAISVLDRGGQTLASQRSDGVGPHNLIASQRKAYTALSTKTATKLFAERAQANPQAANLNTLGELLLLGGGIPLYAGNDLVGALGIAGAGGAEQDEGCALKAAEQVGLAAHL